MYEGGFADLQYDTGFEPFVKLVSSQRYFLQIFENKEKEKEKEYEQSMRNKIKPKCCLVFFEKDEYLRGLVNSNITSESRFWFFRTDWIRCICGKLLLKRDLQAYFSPKEVATIFEQIQKGKPLLAPAPRASNDREDSKGGHGKAEEPCAICKKPLGRADFSTCICGVKIHTSCLKPGERVCPSCKQPLENGSNATVKTTCCNQEVSSDEYAEVFVEYNKAKKGDETLCEDRMLCPNCGQVLKRADLERVYPLAAVERLLRDLFEITCAECKSAIGFDQDFLKTNCGHCYHISCVDFILTGYNDALKCRWPGCDASIRDIQAKLAAFNERRKKSCMVCGKANKHFGEYNCKHYVCVACAEGFRQGIHNCLEVDPAEVTTYCEICRHDSYLDFLIPQCGHSLDVKELRTHLRRFKQVAEAPTAHSGKLAQASVDE